MSKGVYAFLKGISQKMNVIERLEFALVYFEAAVQHFSHHATESPSGITGWERWFTENGERD